MAKNKSKIKIKPAFVKELTPQSGKYFFPTRIFHIVCNVIILNF